MNLKQDTKPEHTFYCADGTILKNLRELAGKLKTISPEAYTHHANDWKNDFHNWIKNVYGNKKLAKEIAFAESSKEAAQIIEKAISSPQKKKAAKRKKIVAVKKNPAKQRRKQAKRVKKTTAAVIVAATKKQKRKPAGKARKRRKTKRNSNRKSSIGRQLKMLARAFGLIK